MRVLLLIAFSLSSFFLFAQDCLPGWGYYRPITITESDGVALTDHTLALSLDAADLVAAGKMLPDAADLRFVDADCNLLSYYIAEVAPSGASEIWLKLPELPANGSVTIQAYYGNPAASPYSDGDATFLFFDDFSEGQVDASKWEPIGGFQTLEVNNGILTYASDGMNPGPRFKFVRTTMSFSEPVVIDFAAEVTNSNGFGFSSVDQVLDRIIFRQSGFGFDTLNQVALLQDTLSNGVSVEQLYPVIRYPRNEMQNATLRAGINQDDQLQLNYFGNNDAGSANSDTYVLEAINMTGFHFILSTFIGFPIYLDYIRIRPYRANTITVTVGAEETILNTQELGSASQIVLFPNPAREQCWLKPRLSGTFELQVFNTTGQMLEGRKLDLNAGVPVSIDLFDWPVGSYLIVLKDDLGQLPVQREQLQVIR